MLYTQKHQRKIYNSKISTFFRNVTKTKTSQLVKNIIIVTGNIQVWNSSLKIYFGQSKVTNGRRIMEFKVP